MKSSILSLCAACALSLSAANAAEQAAPEAAAPTGAPEAAAPPAPAEPKSEAQGEAQPDAKAARGSAAAAESKHHVVALGPAVTDSDGRKGRIHEVKAGDTLWDISDAYLGTPWVWPSVWKSNEEIENPHRIFPGDKLFVSPNEMRRLSKEEAERLLADGQAPASLADGMGDGGPQLPKSFRYTYGEAAGLVSDVEIRGATSIVDSTSERVWLGDHDSVILGLGEGETQVGDQFEIFRTSSAVKDPETERMIGHAILTLGWLEVMEVHPESSVAIVRSSRNEIRRGDRLVPRVKRPSEIPIGPTPDVSGSIAYTYTARVETGSNDIVYLNRGEAAGLEVGSPLEVYRAIGTGHDEAQAQTRQLPDHVVAQMLVVSTTPTTATAVVTRARTELAVGDTFRGSDRIGF